MLEDLYKSFWAYIDKINRNRMAKQNYTAPAHLFEQNNIPYGKGEDQVFDIYYPAESTQKKLKTIIHIHGGAYLGGLREMYAEYCRLLADEGYCVINFEYTSGDKKGFPTPIYDFFEFYEFVKNNPVYSKIIDFDNILLSGDSSGGHIASLIANIQTNENLKKEFKIVGGPDIKGCILICPMLGVYKFNNKWPRERFEKMVFKEYYNTTLKDVCHNLETVSDKFPPSIIISASNDFIKMHAYMFNDKAQELNLYLEHYCITTGKHLSHCSMLTYPYDHESMAALDKVKTFADNVFNDKLEYKISYDKITKRSPVGALSTTALFRSKSAQPLPESQQTQEVEECL